MMCNCGGRTARASARDNESKLTWECCGACGRCGSYVLVVEKVQVVAGRAARLAFRDPALLDMIRQRLERKRVESTAN